MLGTVDKVTRMRVTGWATTGKEGATVEIRVNDELVTLGEPTLMRPGVAAKLGCEPLCGFDVRLQTPLRPGDVVSVCFPGGGHLHNSPNRQPDQKPFDVASLPAMPVCDAWGFSRGTPVDRRYIEGFLLRHAYDIRGRVLEVGDRTYTARFGKERVTKSEILDIDKSNAKADYVADLADAPQLASNCFDCIILTQVMFFVLDLEAAFATVERILKPGGTALITVPGISQISSEREEAQRSSWAFYPRSLHWLLAKGGFDRRKLLVESHGNLKTCLAFLIGLAQEDLGPGDFAATDPRYPLIVSARAVKRR